MIYSLVDGSSKVSNFLSKSWEVFKFLSSCLRYLSNSITRVSKCLIWQLEHVNSFQYLNINWKMLNEDLKLKLALEWKSSNDTSHILKSLLILYQIRFCNMKKCCHEQGVRFQQEPNVEKWKMMHAEAKFKILIKWWYNIKPNHP